MKKSSLLTSLAAAAVMILLVPFSANAESHADSVDAESHANSANAESHAKVTMEEFLKMPADERLEVCVELVASEDLGRCLNFKHDSSPEVRISSERIELEMYRCAKEEGKQNPQDAAACARGRLNKSTGAPSFSDLQIKTAAEVCQKKISDSTKIGTCISAILPHIDSDGKYH